MSASVFQFKRSSSVFWSKPAGLFPSEAEIFHKGFLYSHSSSTQLTPHYYLLTATHLLKVKWWTEAKVWFEEASVLWATVEGFEERNGKGKSVFGFSLRTEEWAYDFYVAEKGELDAWLEELGKFAIMRNITGDYEIAGEIGRGGQSTVYLGISCSTKAKFAIKSYNKTLLAQSQHRINALVNEIDILRSLSHPNVAKLHRVYESDQTVALVMDFYDGVPLSRAILTPFSQTEAFKFMLNLMDILEFLTSKRVIHRDIKPENIMLTDPSDRAQFKLIDFGLAKWYEGTGLCDGSGSPGYYAPEILKKRSHGPMVDIYAAGVLFFTLIEGSNPFRSPSLAETIRRNIDNDISFKSPVWRGIPPTVVSIIRVMTNLNPDHRMNAHDLHTWLLRTSGLKSTAKRLLPGTALSLSIGNSLVGTPKGRRGSCRVEGTKIE
jgi:serine/threonine protein kinase